MIRCTTSDDARTLSHCTIQGETGLVIVVEAGTALSDAARAWLCARFEEALAARALDAGIPLAIAECLHDALRAAPLGSAPPSWVFYVAALASRARVEVCMAGPHRVVLMRSGTVVASLREHILRHDDAPTNWSPELVSTIDRKIHGNIVTRALGKTSTHPPEVVVWRADGPYTLLVCASDAYQGREYRGELGPYLEALCDGALVTAGEGITRIEHD